MENQQRRKNKSQKKSRLSGVISVTSRGVGYLPSELFEEDIEILNEHLNTAFNKDTVEVLIHPRINRERMRGEVTRVIERAKQKFVGTIEKENNLYFLVPDDKRMYVDILLSEKDAEDGVKALVEFIKWNDPKKNPEGKIVEILGRKGEHNVEMRSIVLSHGFETGFPADVEKAAKEIENKKIEILEKESKKRKDFRDITTMTIDPPDAKDFDDALSIRELENGDVEIGVHIADVSHYVSSKSVIDRQAQKRATSIYLVDRTIPMLPEIISNDVSSLNPEEDKLTFSAVFTLSKQGAVKAQWFGETIICSNKRFTYESAQKTLDAKKGEYYKELNIANEIAKILRKKRFKEGSISFEHDEVEFQLDENGKPISIKRKKMFDTNHLIEEFMLLANKKVAEYVYDRSRKSGLRNLMFIYRIHDVPNREKIQELGVFLHAIGYEFNTGGGDITTHEINKLFEKIKGKPVEDLIKIATIRSMSKAIYSTKNIGHFGLSFRYYTHFTSPIRRYPDLMVHRILKSHLNGTGISDSELKHYEKLAITSSEREVEAVEAERDSIRYKQVEYMKEHVGKTFKGTITGITEFGIFVEEENTKAEGLIRLNSMKDDFYTLDKKHYRLEGQKSKKKFNLGDKVKVKLTNTNLDSKSLDFVFV
ncbi:MAG: ribonuclease R [Candidatus Pacebacteria bacterium]|jgi:ribonuclease R|nr:ribonuclease R [Candidatus Paceibacterota bacterium]|tara:strand:- start:22538 stop:24487 length:1950 start_codon:yes stop_codon:yes gene_type:complete